MKKAIHSLLVVLASLCSSVTALALGNESENKHDLSTFELGIDAFVNWLRYSRDPQCSNHSKLSFPIRSKRIKLTLVLDPQLIVHNFGTGNPCSTKSPMNDVPLPRHRAFIICENIFLSVLFILVFENASHVKEHEGVGSWR